MAVRRLRHFAREGAEMELDLDHTISSTARNAGFLDLQMMPERHNTVKVLMLLDVGGSMDDHIVRVQELFSAARSDFRPLDVYYFRSEERRVGIECVSSCRYWWSPYPEKTQ